MKKILSAIILSSLLLMTGLTACESNSGGGTDTTTPQVADTSANTDAETDANTDANTDDTAAGNVELSVIADLVPHVELLKYIEPKLKEEGVTLNFVATMADETTNEKTDTGEVDFNFHQHLPYLNEWNEINNGHLKSFGDIHVEPISAYSDKYKSLDELPADKKLKIVIPNNSTNEYRALRILELNGFIKLKDSANAALRASVADIETYIKDVEIIEVDANIIIATKDDYDIFITNVNKVIEAGIDSTVLFKEGDDSPYANIIVASENLAPEKQAALEKVVALLQSDDTRNYITEHYEGKVIPSKLG